jgi:lipid-A-disaccharide synthase
MKYYVIAGERSGDLHAGNLVRAIAQRDSSASFRGFGGEYMQDAGVTLAVHYRDMAFMGLAELFTNANKIRKYIRRCREDILNYQPDVIILIDYGGFNLQIARFAKKGGFRVFYYIPPKYWAWYENRALWLKPYVDRLFVILPFEQEFFRKFNWDSDYVGNPVLDAIKAHVPDSRFIEKNNIPAELPCIGLLPGSRKQELKSIIPLLIKVVKRFPNLHFLVAAVNNLDHSWYRKLEMLPNVTLIFEDTYSLLLHCKAAIVTSGTATLETGLLKVPQVVVYKANWISYLLAKLMVRVPFISLINLIAGREVVKELIQRKANEKNVTAELMRILKDGDGREGILNSYNDIIKILDTGSASDNTARLMLEDLKRA